VYVCVCVCIYVKRVSEWQHTHAHTHIVCVILSKCSWRDLLSHAYLLVRFRLPNITDAALPTLPLIPGEKYFAFLYKGRPGSSLKKDSDTHTPGWLLYDPVKEMQRMVGWQHGSLSSVLCLCVCVCVCVWVVKGLAGRRKGTGKEEV